MSLIRPVYYSAVVGGWTAFVGWLLAEMLFISGQAVGGFGQAVLVGGVVGAAIGAGLNAVAGMANGQWKQLLIRSLPGLIGGGIGGAFGALVGNVLTEWVGLPRAIGWMLMGLGIGVIEGLYERSPSKIRNGLIGGGLGGLMGGCLFDPLSRLIESGSGMSSRATAFVLLGICIGALIRLAQSIFIEAWLTVLDGYRAGRVLVLSQPVTKLGRAEYLPLPFLGEMSKELDLEHASITRLANGRFAIEDNKTRLGTRVGGQPIQGPVVLKNGDVIKLATNFIRFNERQSKAGGTDSLPPISPVVTVKAAPPPPPKPKVAPTATQPAAMTQPPAGGRPAMPNLAQPAVPPPIMPPKPSAAVPPPVKPSPKPLGATPPPPPPGGTIRPLSPPPPPPPKRPGAN